MVIDWPLEPAGGVKVCGLAGVALRIRVLPPLATAPRLVVGADASLAEFVAVVADPDVHFVGLCPLAKQQHLCHVVLVAKVNLHSGGPGCCCVPRIPVVGQVLARVGACVKIAINDTRPVVPPPVVRNVRRVGEEP